MNHPHAVHISRRSFFRRCCATAAATGLPWWFVERELAQAAEPVKALAANDRPGIALIGCGGMGSYDTLLARNYGDVVAVCDVDQKHVDKAVAYFTKDGKVPQGYSDFRRLLERGDLHGIINGCPDHWHSLVNIAAARAKKDIY